MAERQAVSKWFRSHPWQRHCSTMFVPQMPPSTQSKPTGIHVAKSLLSPRDILWTQFKDQGSIINVLTLMAYYSEAVCQFLLSSRRTWQWGVETNQKRKKEKKKETQSGRHRTITYKILAKGAIIFCPRCALQSKPSILLIRVGEGWDVTKKVEEYILSELLKSYISAIREHRFRLQYIGLWK